MNDVTHIVSAVEQGDPHAAADLVPGGGGGGLAAVWQCGQ
jgi:hypothetical protein